MTIRNREVTQTRLLLESLTDFSSVPSTEIHDSPLIANNIFTRANVCTNTVEILSPSYCVQGDSHNNTPEITFESCV